MSNYTIQVKEICELNLMTPELATYGNLAEVIDAGYKFIFDFDFPLFDESYRETLCKKIISHYYMQEICCESIGLWKLYLSNRLNEIMPYYNQLYKSAQLEFDPLFDTDLTRKGAFTDEGSGSENTTTNATANATGKAFVQDTPQNNIDILDNESDMYVTSVDRSVADNTSNSTGASSREDNLHRDYWETLQGRKGKNASQLLMDYRKTFLNIDLKIIEELKDLFFGLWR